MRSKTRIILLNITGCLLFLALPLLFIPGSSRIADQLTATPTLKEITAYSLLIGYFYLNFFVLIPRFYLQKKYILFSLFTILCFAFITSVPNIALQNSVPGKPFEQQFAGGPPPPNSKFHGPPPGSPNNPGAQFPGPPHEDHKISLLEEATHHLFLFLGVFFFSLLLKINTRWKQAEEEKVTTELSYLRAQVNPHFLFNTLNSIYSMALENAPNTAEAIVKLSGMMRYVLTETNDNYVLLEKDIQYISNYIDFQAIRFGSDLPLNYAVTGNAAGKKIAPLILMPFVENAFKHGINPEEDSFINISIIIDENSLAMKVENRKVNTRLSAEEKTGVGIANGRNRLQLLYPGKHSLQIHDEDTNYLVELKIELS